MKHIRKIMALAVAMVMVLIIGTSAMAASITINSNDSNNVEGIPKTEYTYYEVLKADIGINGTVDQNTGNVTGGTVAYYVDNKDLKDALEATKLFEFEEVKHTTPVRWNVTLKDNTTDGTTIAEALNKEAVKDKAYTTDTFSSDGTKAQVTNLQPGYYLILSSLGTKLAVQTLSDVTINEKNEYPSVEKEEDKITASIGEIVTYTLKVTIPESVAEKNIDVYDTLTKGLTMNTKVEVSGAIEDGVSDLKFVINNDYTAIDGETQYKVTIPAKDVLANKGKTLTLTYSAKVNDNAIINTDDVNKAYIKYDHYQSTEVEVKVKNYGFTIKKIDGKKAENKENSEKLKLDAITGAEFSLWDEDEDGHQIFVKKNDTGVYRVDLGSTSGDAIEVGEATIEGLAEGKYYLQEDVAPNGYNKLKERVEITVNATTSSPGVDIAIENNQGSVLPSTGGMGTTIFYVVGGILVAVAAVLLIAKRRMKGEE